MNFRWPISRGATRWMPMQPQSVECETVSRDEVGRVRHLLDGIVFVWPMANGVRIEGDIKAIWRSVALSLFDIIVLIGVDAEHAPLVDILERLEVALLKQHKGSDL
ncbi:hypothetical protein ACLESD_00220 [Pyxidicoccus sp. 3LFB2]